MDLFCNEVIRTDYESDAPSASVVPLPCQTATTLAETHQPETPAKRTISSSYISLGTSPPTPDSTSTASSGYHSGHSTSNHQSRPMQHAEKTSHEVYADSEVSRNVDFVNIAAEDPTFLTKRCLQNALLTEQKRIQPVLNYFKTVQKDITPPMRKIVAEWMMEVCAEEKCQEEVVLLALIFMDRFLASKSVKKTHLQILGAACLLLASKLREPSCRALSAEMLVFYTDNSIFKGDLIKWELLVLSRLGWDLSTVTPLDFLELLLIRLPINGAKCADISITKVRQHAQAFVSLAAKEHHFLRYTASTIAAASIAAALSGLNWHTRTNQSLHQLLNLLIDLTHVEQDSLQQCMLMMESYFEEQSRNLQPYVASVTVEQQQHEEHNKYAELDIPTLEVTEHKKQQTITYALYP